jgi:hypothetical protein
MVGSECVPVEQGIYLSMHAALRSKSIEWLALNVSQWNNVSIHACSIKE